MLKLRKLQNDMTPNQKAALALASKLAAFVGILFVTFRLVFGLGVVGDEAMYPRLRNGDLVLYYRMERTYAAGDVVAARVGGKEYFGRIVAVGGDTVDLSQEGQLVINGYPQSEEVFFETDTVEGGTALPCTIPEGSFFLLGDHRTEAVDSRAFGPVSRAQIEGKAITLLRRRGI
ncbi:MAG: signal peptidase I [Faecalibacterium sp.]|jgi:signal peptidase I|nr:signal peptidase I [Faecalibacterium sp.]